jgi:N-acetylglucosamine-6-phosphate deacetylase
MLQLSLELVHLLEGKIIVVCKFFIQLEKISVTTIPKCIQNLSRSIDSLSGINPLEFALRSATLTPGNLCLISKRVITVNLHLAKFLGIDNKMGTLRFGSNADLVLLDENLNIYSTFMKGVRKFISI